jgi:hypothetical protein
MRFKKVQKLLYSGDLYHLDIGWAANATCTQPSLKAALRHLDNSTMAQESKKNLESG